MEIFSRQNGFILCGGIDELNCFKDIKTNFIEMIPWKDSSIKWVMGYDFL